ncbi:hypothetical protein [Desulfuromonas sp.]|uniref:hypothetical protein n=1 Tax=Desulfuromonas sp. TaxID=892 RepID=UPI0025BADE4B|nr:hypothetical protein [Desulfuromonas sp.]
MVVGFNHNFRYKDFLVHIQTEDSGLKSPHIVTLLYRGGIIIASLKASYDDILGTDDLEEVVEGRMKDQHRTMLRRLKSGEFDTALDQAEEKSPASKPGPPAAPPAPAPAPDPPPAPAPIAPQATPPTKAPPAATAPKPAAGRPAEKNAPGSSLERLVFDYLRSGR